jgi:peptide/nickel transport system ATP-binding protein
LNASATTARPGAPLLEVRGLGKRYRLPREVPWRAAPLLTALADVSFTLHAGSSLGVVGESGSGKSTLARLVMALEAPSEGQVLLAGDDLHRLDPARLRAARTRMQMVFQDPYGSLDPRRRVGQTVAEPLLLLRGEGHVGDRDAMRRRAAEALEAVGLSAADLDKYPHEFSGGQRQRIAIARALVTRPALIVADEPVSALDVSVQAQVLNLMRDVQQSHGVTYLFVSHDLAVIDHVCDDVLVLRHGRVIERGAPEALFAAPREAYTQALLEAVPRFPRWGPGEGAAAAPD